jgi:ABC-type multidrug transport system ATPase subunit
MTNPSTFPASITIRVKNISKKYGNNRVFRKLSYDFEQGKKYAISGPNGSGKSTLLKVIAGIITPDEGNVQFNLGEKTIIYDELYKQVTFCAPYMELPEELTLSELLKFHTRLRKLNIMPEQFRQELELESSKEIRNFSSGMKQRLKLALAFYTDSTVILLDEPTANLDKHWIGWYFETVQKISADKLLVVSSNIPEEYSFCDSVLDLNNYKL